MRISARWREEHSSKGNCKKSSFEAEMYLVCLRKNEATCQNGALNSNRR